MKRKSQVPGGEVAERRASPYWDGDIYLSSQQVKHRYGGVLDLTLWRWLQDSSFPQPIIICGRRYWHLAKLQEFEMACARASSKNGGRLSHVKTQKPRR